MAEGRRIGLLGWILIGGVKIIGIYLATTAVAVIIGLLVAGILNPAAGMKLTPAVGFKAPSIPALKDVMLNLVTTNPFESLSKGDALPVIVFALFFGIAAVLAKDKGKAVIGMADSAAETMYKLTTIVMWFAPLGVFSLIAATIAKQGPQVLLPFVNLILACYLAYVLHGAIVYSSIVKTMGTSTPYAEQQRHPARDHARGGGKCGTSALAHQLHPPARRDHHTDGTAIYQGIAVLFIAAIYNVQLGFGQYIMIILLATLGSIGTAGVPGAGLIMLAMVLQGVGLPLEGLGLIPGIDVILDMGRTCLNVTGDVVCTTAVAYSEGEFSPETAAVRQAAARVRTA